MKEIRIIITIQDPEVVQDYQEIDEEFIVDDVRNNPQFWIQTGQIEIEKIGDPTPQAE